MTERELRRTALIIPPRGRAVLCCWAVIPGLLAAPFVFWQSMPAGVVFCLLWAALVAVVRVGLSRAIVQSIVGVESELPVITLEPRLEQILLNSIQKAGQGQEEGVLLEPSMAEKLQRSLVEAAQRQEMLGKPVILLVAGPVRAMLSRFARLAVPSMHVLAYQEIPDNKQVTIVATVGQN